MNIFVLNYEYPPLGGGAGVICENINKELVNLGNSVTVITSSYSNLPSQTIETGISVFRVPSKRKHIYQSNVFEMMSWIRESFLFCKQHFISEKPDIIIAHFSIPGGEVAYRLHKLFQIPYVIISHGHDIPWYYPKQMFKYHLITALRIKKILKHSLALFVQSDYMYTNAIKFLKNTQTPCIQIPNGCNLDAFPIVLPPKQNKLNILYGGRLVKQKDPFTFLKSIDLLVKSGVDFHVNVIGNGSLLPKMKQWVEKKGYEKYFTFHGWVDKTEVKLLLKQSHLFVLPSQIEGMSMAIIEAVCSGVFVITTPVSGNNELIENGKNGFIVPVKNPKELLNAILQFNTLRLSGFEITKQLIESKRESYDWKRIGIKYNSILNQDIKR